MQDAIRPHRVGDAVITKVPGPLLEGVDPAFLFPRSDPAVVSAEGGRLGPGSFDQGTLRLHMSIHAWLVRTPRLTVLIDASAGNGKDRPGMPELDRLDEPFIERLRLSGATTDEVDAVLLTHLHADHVGWNTRKLGGRWAPTFPNARYVFSGRERAYCASLSASDPRAEAILVEAGLGRPVRLPDPGVFDDSVRPIIEAGLAQEVAPDGSEVIDGFRFHPSAGHSIDHACITFVSGGECALFWGDVIHHPLQFARPDWNSAYCEFPDAAKKVRRWAMGHAADLGALVFTAHFAESSAGRVRRDGDGFGWDFA